MIRADEVHTNLSPIDESILGYGADSYEKGIADRNDYAIMRALSVPQMPPRMRHEIAAGIGLSC